MASQQEQEVKRLLGLIVNDFKSQLDLSKVTSNLLHKGIVVDFWVPEYNLVIEVHGIQHYKPSGFGRNKVDTLTQFNKQLNRDGRLKNICEECKINYMEIPHNQEVSFVQLFSDLEQYKNE